MDNLVFLTLTLENYKFNNSKTKVFIRNVPIFLYLILTIVNLYLNYHEKKIQFVYFFVSFLNPNIIVLIYINIIKIVDSSSHIFINVY